MAPAGRAPPIARLVRDDAQQPGPDRRPLAKAGEGGVRLEEGFLDGIVGIGLRAHEVRGPQGDVLVAAHDLLVRHDVAGPGTRDQFGVFDVDGPPRQPYPVHRRTRDGSRPAPDMKRPAVPGGSDGPRAAWVYLNWKLALCVVSSTSLTSRR